MMLHMVAFTLVLVGALNWGLVGLVGVNLVNWLLTALGLGMLENFVYVLVGVAAVYTLLMHQKDCKLCGAKK